MKKSRCWIYIVAFIIGAGFPIVNLITFDSKKIVIILFIALICSLVFGTIVNFVLNCLEEKKEK